MSIEIIDPESRVVMVFDDQITDHARMEFIERHPRWLECDNKYKWSCKHPCRKEEYPIFKNARDAIDWAISEYK